MISRAEAEDSARGHLGGEVGITEFDLGYVAWRMLPRPAGPTAVPETTGQPTVVIDRETGELTRWGSLPAAAVAAQFTAHRAARDRFPPDVREVLEQAGWWPGRDRNATVTAWFATARATFEGITFGGPALAALTEFGGLRIPQRGQGDSPDGGFASRFFPVPGFVGTDGVRSFAERTGITAAPVGVNADGPADLAIDGDGRVYLLMWADDFLIADSLDAALVWMVRGGPLRPVAE